jgi:cytidyltransferase-like protein
MKKIIIVSGYFNPIHKGHIEYFKNAASLGQELWVIVNNDYQRALKGSKHFMNEDERKLIVESIKYVNKAFVSIDHDRTVSESLRAIVTNSLHQILDAKFAFANGGDQNNNSIPEREVCESLGIELIDGLGEKIQSSSWLLTDHDPRA